MPQEMGVIGGCALQENDVMCAITRSSGCCEENLVWARAHGPKCGQGDEGVGLQQGRGKVGGMNLGAGADRI